MSSVLLMIALTAGGTSVAQPAPDVPRQDMVLKWNEILLQAIRTERTPPPLAARNMALVHVAIYDAVNAIEQTHTPYRVQVPAESGTSAEAAVASAAHRVLVALYPRQKASLDTTLLLCLAAVPDSRAREQGINLGKDVADKMLEWRAGDGAAGAAGSYTPKAFRGRWQPTPPGFAPALFPDWGYVAPFAIRKGTQLRPPGPPPLSSAAYARAFNEVKALGGRDSTARTAEQTQIAWFWSDDLGTSTPPGHWNKITQDVARARGTTLAENARLFALLNLSLADSAVLCWVLKFTYEFWRPATAIQNADPNENPDTVADPNWTPLLKTPPFPAYTSGHSTFSGAASTVLVSFFGTDNVRFTTTSEGLPEVRRSFASFSAAAEEAGQSRIYGGIHWQFDNTDGLAVGRNLGQYVYQNFLQPRPRTAPNVNELRLYGPTREPPE